MRYRTGQQAIVECDEGYEIRNGNNKLICKEDGSWEPQGQKEMPQCKERACQEPETDIDNGSLEINGHKHGPSGGYKAGSVLVYLCNEGFVLLPFSAGKRVCRKGKWEGTIPACGKALQLRLRLQHFLTCS